MNLSFDLHLGPLRLSLTLGEPEPEEEIECDHLGGSFERADPDAIPTFGFVPPWRPGEELDE